MPVREVTVFSDRARVVRRGELRLEPGSHTVSLPRLPTTIDPQSVRVEVSGARLVRVAVRGVTRDSLPKTEAQKLIDHLLSLRDEENALTDHRETLLSEERFLDSIRPHGEPNGVDKLPPLLLNAAGWSTAQEFFDTRRIVLEKTLAEVAEKLRLKEKEIATAQAQANQLLGQGGDDAGFLVDAVLDGTGGTAHLGLTYLAAGATWHPAYDVHYQPGATTVELGFSGLVAQETGEDWTDAALTLSTAVPATVTDLPRLAVWKIGDRERFIPTPEAVPETLNVESRRTTGAPSATPALDQTGADGDLRAQLQSAVAETSRARALEQAKEESGYEKTLLEAEKKVARKSRREKDFSEDAAPAESPPPAPPPPAPVAAFAAPATESIAATAAPSRSVSQKSVSFEVPSGWAPPALAADLPAMLAGGYEFTYSSAQNESVRTGAEARRVPLFTETAPADSWIRILPALSRSAYLVAEVTNSGSTPWLQGQAHLFVGADLVGDAVVPTTAPGEKVTLPLGIDDAIKVDRNVQVVSTERGVFSRQDVSAYQVVIELLNTRRTPVPVRVFEQVPLAQQKEVEVTLTKTDPPPFKDDKGLKEEGRLEWRSQLGAGEKRTLSFTYEVARPKGWKLWQTSRPGVSP
jgi:hypothetical protein